VDRPPAAGAAARADDYADRLLAAAREGSAPAAAQAAAAREELGRAIAGYRQARAAWRVDAPEPRGAGRELAEARRDMERAETAAVARTPVAPRADGHELDPAAVRMTGRMAVERARAAAERLPPATREAATRYASAQEKVLAAVAALSAAPDPEKAAAARTYQAAKAEALAALADYFAALAAREARGQRSGWPPAAARAAARAAR
jgi:colicin import membrane protein/SWI/SNF-related matrix-associated actin-dependent regulator 1 of chromatin subfamily A